MTDDLASVLERVSSQLEKLDHQVNATDRLRPGLALRVDRIESMFAFIKWTIGTGLLAVLAAIGLLWKILQALGGSPQ